MQTNDDAVLLTSKSMEFALYPVVEIILLVLIVPVMGSPGSFRTVSQTLIFFGKMNPNPRLRDARTV